MIPFPGESVLIEDAADITTGTDGSLWTDLVHRAGSRTFDAGDSWRMLAYSGDMDYLEETGLDLTVRWVVEVLSGTVTFSAAEGLDPTYANYGATLGTSLGSHTVTGPATLKIDSTFTGDQVADLSGSVSAAFVLGLDATSGSAVVQQVKLEVWPAAGAVGAFVDQPGFDTSPVSAGAWAAADDLTRAGSAADPGTEASWDAAAAAMVGAPDLPPYTFGAIVPTGAGSAAHAEASAQMSGSQSNDGVNILTTLGVSPSLTMLIGVDWQSEAHIGPGVTVTYTRPPTEVRDEAPDYLWPQTGTGSTVWVNASAVVIQTGQPAAVVPALTFSAAADDSPDITPTGSTFVVDVPLVDDGTALAAPSAGGSVTTTVPLSTGGRYLFVSISHTATSAPAAWPGTFPGSPTDPAVQTGIDARIAFGVGDPDAPTFAPIKSYASMPPYRVWVPTAVEQTDYPLRLIRRGDGLGMGSGRVLSTGTRQNSTRVFGVL